MGIRDMDEDQLRSGSAVLLGACFIMLPVLVGRMGVPTLLIVSAIGGLAILPVWRYAGGSLEFALDLDLPRSVGLHARLHAVRDWLARHGVGPVDM